MSKKFILFTLFSIFFIFSCSGNENSPEDKEENLTISEKTITGKLKMRVWHMVSNYYSLEDYNKGSATIQVNVSQSDSIAEGLVDENGNFTITYKSVIPYNLLTNQFIMLSQITSSPNDLLSTITSLEWPRLRKVIFEDGKTETLLIEKLDSNDELLPTLEQYRLSCFDKNGTITGTATSNRNFDLTVSKGWNIIKEDIISTPKTNTIVNDFDNDVVFYINENTTD